MSVQQATSQPQQNNGQGRGHEEDSEVEEIEVDIEAPIIKHKVPNDRQQGAMDEPAPTRK